MQLTYLNLRENLKLMLAMQGITYIFDTQREFNAINKFVNAEFTADYVIELIGKLIYIKRHAKFRKDSFWQGCAVNISDAYNYRVKIETVYPTISTGGQTTPIRQTVVTDCPVGSYPLTNVDPWQNFLNWSKKLTQSTQAEIAKMTAISDDKMILITGEPNDNLARTITAFFNDAGMSTVFKNPNVRTGLRPVPTGDTNETATN
ncbi:MAG: hypothetical protein IPL26_19860 [Leptospiraceae bacterium]|nr:hypothetical protein [Leptospiraceae bacterium]